LEVERDHKILDKDAEEEKDGKFNKIKHMEENVKAKDDVDTIVDKEMDIKIRNSEIEKAQKNVEKEIISDQLQESVKRDVDSSIIKDTVKGVNVKDSKSSFKNPNQNSDDTLEERSSADVEDDEGDGDTFNGKNDFVVIG